MHTSLILKFSVITDKFTKWVSDEQYFNEYHLPE